MFRTRQKDNFRAFSLFLNPAYLNKYMDAATFEAGSEIPVRPFTVWVGECDTLKRTCANFKIVVVLLRPKVSELTLCLKTDSGVLCYQSVYKTAC